MTEVTIKFKDRNRSDLKVKLQDDNYLDYFNGLVRVPIATNGKAFINKWFTADIIEEITEVIKPESEVMKNESIN